MQETVITRWITNWVGSEGTREHVKEGNYDDNNIKIAVNTD